MKVLTTLKMFLSRYLHVDSDVVVVDDGSTDKTAEVARKQGVAVIHHVVNRGLGGALATGLAYARNQGYDIALTMDSDGQHVCDDIPVALQPILTDRADVVIGSRLLGQKGMPWDRVIINMISNAFTWIIFGIWTTDSQSGFRVFNRKALEVIQLKTQGMEVSSEFFHEIRRHQLRYAEIPIQVLYTKYSRAKGQSNLNSLNVGWKLLLRLFR